MMRRLFSFAMLALALATPAARAGIITTYEAAGVQSSSASNITVETFDGFTTGNYTNLSTTVGTFDYATIQAANVYGGAGGVGNFLYPGLNNGSVSSLSVSGGPQTYFGFWWSAADANNSLDFYSGGVGGTLVGSFDPTTALGALAGNPAYYGNPNGGGDSSELFAFINFYFTGGTTFDTIVVAGSSFESDNWTISDDPGSISGTTIGTPEPTSLALFGIGIAGLAGYRWKRRKVVAA